jgi:predicted MFS family arabinose efflux permease
MTGQQRRAWYALAVLFAINAVNFFDRLVIGVVAEPIRREYDLDDKTLSLLTTAFTLLYAVAGLPLGRIADRFSRTRLLSAGVIVWSALTGLSGLALSFWQIVLARLGVGAAEAACAPAATSLIGDLFPSEKRARAMSLFMLGLPVGIALSFAVSGAVAKAYGWRAAFFVAGVPGILFGVLALFISEPVRSQARRDDHGGGSAYRRILSSPTMRWLMLSGAIHNFSLYAVSFFLTPFLIRYHKLDIQDAALAAMVVNGIMTIPGLLLGGWIGDAARRRRASGPLAIVTAASFMSAPLFYFGLELSPGNISGFLVFFGAAFALMYFYYAIVYSTIQDISEPGSRATAMAVYFLVMYILGGALGPYAVGALSDSFTMAAAADAGEPDLEVYRAAGLHSAMYIVPMLSVALGVVMLMATRSIAKPRP